MGLDLVLRILKTVIGLFGILGNTLVCVVIYKVAFMHTLTNALLFNQAAVDLLGSILLLLEGNVPVPERLPDSPVGWLLCRVWVGDLLLWGTFHASTLNLLSVTVDRFVAIVLPLRYPALLTRRRVVLMVVASWLLGFIEQGVYLALVQEFSGGMCSLEPSTKSGMFGVLHISVTFFLPSVLMLTAYTAAICVLRRDARRVVPASVLPTAGSSQRSAVAVGEGTASLSTPPQLETRDGALRRASWNVFKTLLLVFVSYLTCWTPNQITFLLFNLGWSFDFASLTVVPVALNSCINPLIYGLQYKRFRQGIRKLLGHVVTDHELTV